MIKIIRNEYNYQKENEENLLSIDLSLIKESELNSSTIPTPIDTIITRLEAGFYLIPNYQRKYVWKEKQIVGLMLSVVKNIPIPRLTMYYDPEKGYYTILDGQQRLVSLYFYVKGLYPINDTISRRSNYKFGEIGKLVDSYNNTGISKEEKERIKIELKDKHGLKFKKYSYVDNSEDGNEKTKKNFSFDNFTDKDKMKFFNKTFEFGVISVSNETLPIDKLNKLYTDIFRLLNSEGIPLSNQEIRNGIYFDSYLYKSVNNFNENNRNWNYVKKEIKEVRSENMEFLLRLLALDEYFKINSKERFENFDKIKLNDKKEITNIVDIENYNTYSSIIDKFSEKFTEKKDENLLKEEIDTKIKKLEYFFNSFYNLNERSKISILNMEAFFLAASKTNQLDEKLIIDVVTLNQKIKSERKTSSKEEILSRVLQAVVIMKGVEHEKI